MDTLDNFSSRLRVLQDADFQLADENEIYRMGVIGQFNLTFDLALKTTRALLSAHGLTNVETGTPRETIQLGCKHGIVDSYGLWIEMLTARVAMANVDDQEKIGETLILVREIFIPAFVVLEHTLKEKAGEIDGSAPVKPPRSRAKKK